MKKVGKMTIDEKAFDKALAAKAEGQKYVGASDPLLDFGKASSFVREGESGKKFSIKLTNKSADKSIGIQLNKIIGGIREGYNLLANGAIDNDLIVVGTPNNASMLAAYLESNPSRVLSVKFKVDDEEQLDEPIVFVKDNLFGSVHTESRVPSDEQSQETNNPKNAEITGLGDWLCSDKSTLLYKVRPGRSVNVIITFGASVDTAKALCTKAEDAQVTVAAALLRSQE